jgi:glycosyltransferase involved in cell wall biosynthesis
MRLLYVVQRYGASIAGGAEQHCREMAERMAARGHHVEVATTCAQSYVDWANAYPPGRSELNGVVVHRFEVDRARDNPQFNQLNQRMITGRGPRPLPVQREWMRLQGPHAPALPRWLEETAPRFDVVICFTYLYWTTWAGLRTTAGLVPTVLHPTVHDEPPLALSIFDEVFRTPDAFALSTPEEIELIRRRFRIDPRGDVIGIGVDLERADPSAFRTKYPLAGAPYVLYVGRIDEGKGAGELVDFFGAFKDRNPGPLQLVLLGEPVMEIARRDDVTVTGFVDYGVRDSAIAGALALMQPSYFESFSMVLTEAFAQGRPALVQASCDVLAGHAQRSGAAIPYHGFADFEAALEVFVDELHAADAMGAAGRRYVEREYAWDVVLDRYERLLETAAARGPVAQANSA